MATLVFDGRTIQDHYPGIGRFAFNLARALVVQFPEHQFRLLFDPTAYNSRFDVQSLTDYPNLVPVPIRARLFSREEQRLGRNSFILGNAHLWHSPYYALPLAVPIPAVVTLADLTPLILPEEMPNPSKRVLYRGLNQAAAWRARAVITFSEASRFDLERILNIPTEKLFVVPLAPDPSFRPVSSRAVELVRTALNLPRVYVLYVGSNKPHKNLPRLIEAWAAVQSDATLVIAGTWDPRYPQAQQLVAHWGLHDRVQFRRNIAEQALPALLNGARAFVFPSVHEGFGLPPLEAMACGTPVVCSHASSLPEVTGEAAFVFDPLNPRDISDTLMNVLENANLRFQMRARGLAQAKQFSWERTALQTMQVYRSIAELT